MIHIAFMGTAHIHTPGFIKRLNEIDEVGVKYVYDHDQSRAAENAANLRAEVCHLDTILSDPEIRGVVICSETNLHEKLVLAATEAGKHMFVEKPLGFGAQDSYRMAEAIKEAGLIFQTGYFMRGQAHHLFLREQIKKGNFGQITRIRMSNCHRGSLGGWFDTDWRWMTDPKIAGCGAFGDLGTHVLDIMLWLMGTVSRVTGSIHVATGRYEHCDEFGEALLHFDNDVVGSIAAGWVDVVNPVRLEIAGTEGHAVMFNDELYFHSDHVPGADGQTPWTNLPAQELHPLVTFVDHLAGRTDSPLIDVTEAADVCAVMEAIYQGATNHAWVEPAYQAK